MIIYAGGKRKMRLRHNYLTERMKDEEFRAAYYELEPDFVIAQALLEYRTNNDLTQAELAKRININRSDLSKLESADANPTLKTLKKIAAALETNLQIYFEPYLDVNVRNFNNTKVINFCENLNSANKSNQQSYSISLEKHKTGLNLKRRNESNRALA